MYWLIRMEMSCGTITDNGRNGVMDSGRIRSVRRKHQPLALMFSNVLPDIVRLHLLIDSSIQDNEQHKEKTAIVDPVEGHLVVEDVEVVGVGVKD